MENANSRLVDMGTARRTLIPWKNGKQVSGTTVWRWVNKGVAGVQLPVVYAGSTPCVSRDMVDEFFQKVTAAKLAQREAKQASEVPVTDSERKAAGIL